MSPGQSFETVMDLPCARPVWPVFRARHAGSWPAAGAILSALLLVSLPACTSSHIAAQSSEKSKTSTADRSQVHALARLEPDGGVITVGARPGARVQKILVQEGQDVRAGEPLAWLEGYDQARASLALAEAQRTGGEFKRKAKRDELALEREAFDRLKETRLEHLKATIKDLKAKVGEPAKDAKPESTTPAVGALGGGGMVPPIVKDAAAAQLKGELSRAEVQLEEMQVNLDLLARKRELEDREAAETTPEKTLLDRQVDVAKAALADATVVAPSAGRILRLDARPGEVSAGALLTMGDVSTMTARAEVFQTDVTDLNPGDVAEVTILGRPVAGEVTRVGTIVGKNAIASLDPTALADRRVADVIVRLADPSTASKLVNMQVDVSIRKRATGGGAPAQ